MYLVEKKITGWIVYYIKLLSQNIYELLQLHITQTYGHWQSLIADVKANKTKYLNIAFHQTRACT